MTDTSNTGTSSNPTVEQLSTARTAHWHQHAEPLQTLEGLRNWLNTTGLVLYTPRGQQIPAPAPSFVEATLGAANSTPSLADIEQARGLLARLISEGAALPLNLLGVQGGMGTDVPDFVVSAAVFSYIFTLRGNKAWKQSPVTAGPVKVSPLALAAYEVLAAKVSLSAYDLTTALGKEVTEAAVLRALTELWSQLRVIPVPQTDGTPTLWELTTTRFTKQIKSGANAGQPSALSALISLYLGQALVATEEEIETFLSPLASRSRLRDVVHVLLSDRQLETIVIEGKTLLFVTGDLPTFAAAEKPAVEAQDGAPTEEEETVEGASRISKFAPKPGSKIGTGLRSRPTTGGKPAFGNKPSFGGARERRPFQRDDRSERPARPTYNKPWEEDKAARPAAASSEAGSEGQSGTEERRPSRPSFGGKPSFGSRPGFAGRPSSGSRPGFAGKPRFEGKREGFAGKQQFGRENGAGESRPPRRDFAPRPEGEGAGRTFSKPGTFGRKREESGSRPAFGRDETRAPRRDFRASGDGQAGGGFSRPSNGAPRSAGGPGDRGDRPAFGGPRKPFTPRAGGDRPGFTGKPSFGRDRTEQAGGGSEAPRKVFRKFDAPRTPKPFNADRPARPFNSDRPARPFNPDRPARPFNSDRPARPFNSDRPARPFNADRPARPFNPDRPARPFSSDRPARPFNADRPARPFNSDRPARPFNPDAPRSEGRPSFGPRAGGSGGKKPFSKSGSFSKAGGPFAKFADGKKPFRKPGPGKPSSGGARPPMRDRGPAGGSARPPRRSE